MLSVVFATACGLVWGVGDFAGGKAAQRAAALPVAWGSKLIGLPLLGLYLMLTCVPPQLAPLAWGAVAGAAGIGGVGAFFLGVFAGAAGPGPPRSPGPPPPQ